MLLFSEFKLKRGDRHNGEVSKYDMIKAVLYLLKNS